MEKKSTSDDSTCNRFVAFLDIMGFRDMVFRKKPEEIKDMFESLRPTLHDLETTAKEKLKKKAGTPFLANNPIQISYIFPITFSDSIILISNDDSLESAEAMLINVWLILHNAIEKEIPMKGALAYGEMTADIDKSLYFGQPLIDAYELQKELLLFGVVLHHTMEERLKIMNILTPNKDSVFFVVNKHYVHMKSGKIKHYIIDTTPDPENNQGILKYYEHLENLYNNVSGKSRIYVDNTIELAREMIEMKDKVAREMKKS